MKNAKPTLWKISPFKFKTFFYKLVKEKRNNYHKLNRRMCLIHKQLVLLYTNAFRNKAVSSLNRKIERCHGVLCNNKTNIFLAFQESFFILVVYLINYIKFFILIDLTNSLLHSLYLSWKYNEKTRRNIAYFTQWLIKKDR